MGIYDAAVKMSTRTVVSAKAHWQRSHFQALWGCWQNSVLCDCRTEAFFLLLGPGRRTLQAVTCRLLSVSETTCILYYMEFPNMATSFLIASKEEESRKVNPIISCNTITQSCTSSHTHPITFTIFHFLEASQVLPSHKKRGSYEGGNHSGHIKSVNNTVS
jgi:hypothetical protein